MLDCVAIIQCGETHCNGDGLSDEDDGIKVRIIDGEVVGDTHG